MRTLSKAFLRSSIATRAAAVLAALAAMAVVAFSPLSANPRAASREIVVVARQMAFYVEGSSEPNPTLRVRRGETVRIVLRNDEPGVVHDLKVGDLNATIEPVRAGATGSVTFRAPDRPGRYEYVCRPHAQMMTGVLLVD
jgi:plastocyanin